MEFSNLEKQVESNIVNTDMGLIIDMFDGSLEFDEEEDKIIVAAVEKLQEDGSRALEASGLVSDDGIIDPRDTRTVIGMCLSIVGNKPIEGTKEFGVFRL